MIESDKSVPTFDRGDSARACDGAPGTSTSTSPETRDTSDDCIDENWSTQLLVEASMSDGVRPSWPDEIIDAEPLSERSSLLPRGSGSSTLEATLDSDAGAAAGSASSMRMRGAGAFENDCSSRVTPSTSMPSRMCAPSVGSSAMIVNAMSSWFCSNRRRRLVK